VPVNTDRTAFELGDRERAVARALEAREAADASGDAVAHGGTLMVLANVALLAGDQGRAQRLYDESIDVHRRAGDSWGLGILLSVAAGLRIIQEDFDQARTQASEAMSLCQELEDPRGIAWILDVCAGLLAAGGDADGAARLWGASDGLLEKRGRLARANHRVDPGSLLRARENIARQVVRNSPRRRARDANPSRTNRE
jgi:non-specific serine/threonine protein kinase